VYVVLGILYESFIHPVTILMSLPPASVGALAFLWLFGFDLSVIAIIGLLMLIGIVKKNPIMMMTMAAIFGIMPIAIGFGAGAELRQPLGVAVVGGLIVSQLLTLYTIP